MVLTERNGGVGNADTNKNNNRTMTMMQQEELENTENISSVNNTFRRNTARRAIRGGKMGLTSRRSLKTSPRHTQLKDPPTISPEKYKMKREDNYSITPKKNNIINNKNNNDMSTIKTKTKQEVKTSSKWNWKSTLLILLVEGCLLIGAILFVSPSYEGPSSSSKPFFHTVSQGDPFSFELDVEAWPEPTYQWRLNGVDLIGQTNRKLIVEEAAMKHSGTYTCLIENVAGRLVWEEGYVNVIEGRETNPSSIQTEQEQNISKKHQDTERVRNARMCLLTRAPEPVLRSASTDGGAAVIAAGESAGYLDCFEGLKKTLISSKNDPERKRKQLRALDLLRSLHGSSKQRSVLVNVVAALDDLASAKLESKQEQLDDLSTRLAFQAGLYCASTPQCTDDSTRLVGIIMNALVGTDL